MVYKKYCYFKMNVVHELFNDSSVFKQNNIGYSVVNEGANLVKYYVKMDKY